VEDVERAVVRLVLRELQDSMALVNEEEYDRRFEEYFRHVTASIRGTRVSDPQTREEKKPDPNVLRSVERLLPTGEDIDLFRQKLIGKVAASSLARPGTRPNYRLLFPDILRALKSDFYSTRQVATTQVEDDLLLVGTPGWESVPNDRRDRVETSLANMGTRHGYPRECALEMIGYALRRSRAQKKAGTPS